MNLDIKKIDVNLNIEEIGCICSGLKSNLEEMVKGHYATLRNHSVSEKIALFKKQERMSLELLKTFSFLYYTHDFNQEKKLVSLLVKSCKEKNNV